MSALFDKAIQAFDEYNSKDPNLETVDGKQMPKELLYARRMSQRLVEFKPDASEPLRLAVRCQHIGRWEIPRKSYPMDRKGYLQWRNKLKEHHAAIAEEILLKTGYDQETIERVKFLVQKKQMKHDPETQTLEDVVCLVFMDYYFEEFAGQHDDDKVVNIVRKTWSKMSEKGRKAALQLRLSDKSSQLVTQALS